MLKVLDFIQFGGPWSPGRNLGTRLPLFPSRPLEQAYQLSNQH